MLPTQLIAKDLKHNWHPCSQMKDYENFPPMIVEKAYGSYIELANGKKIIDAISSWWCKSLGHNHPRLKKALLNQVERFEHVIFANTTNDIMASLSERLSALTKTLNKVFYAGDGSSIVEAAMKMSLHSRMINGQVNKNKFIALKNSYHGETAGALSVSDVGIYKKPYLSMTFDTYFIDNIPYVNNRQDPLWNNCESEWKIIEKTLEEYAETTTAIIIEPIVQGAGGMKIYAQDFIKRLRQWTHKNNVHLIADEIMTGFGRTGQMFAYQHANIEPDFLCLAKGLTGGWMPFSAVLTTNDIYQTFYDDYDTGKAFLHSHTFSGHALAGSIALEVLNIFEELDICQQVKTLETEMVAAMHRIADHTGKLSNIRHIGGIVAADLIPDPITPRLGFDVYKKAVEFGALLRPLGNTIYWLPPLNIEMGTLKELESITQKAILTVC
ncbi:MAG: adenosylmethionine--8-amino-7-oxononanoate transaminase [Gammaproteobacteria bacterium]